jgi:predicted DsbA family dithiol-disulfide isomerase
MLFDMADCIGIDIQKFKEDYNSHEITRELKQYKSS